MKKFLSCLLALLMTASLLAGCGQQKTDDYNGGDVTEPDKCFIHLVGFDTVCKKLTCGV